MNGRKWRPLLIKLLLQTRAKPYLLLTLLHGPFRELFLAAFCYFHYDQPTESDGALVTEALLKTPLPKKLLNKRSAKALHKYVISDEGIRMKRCNLINHRLNGNRTK